MTTRYGYFSLVDQVMGGQLLASLRAYRTKGLSWEEVSRCLFADHGVTVSGQTLRRWAPNLDLGPVTDDAKAS